MREWCREEFPNLGRLPASLLIWDTRFWLFKIVKVNRYKQYIQLNNQSVSLQFGFLFGMQVTAHATTLAKLRPQTTIFPSKQQAVPASDQQVGVTFHQKSELKKNNQKTKTKNVLLFKWIIERFYCFSPWHGCSTGCSDLVKLSPTGTTFCFSTQFSSTILDFFLITSWLKSYL